jgi:hypothetical protein
MVRFDTDLGDSSLNVRKITGRSDLQPQPGHTGFFSKLPTICTAKTEVRGVSAERLFCTRPHDPGLYPIFSLYDLSPIDEHDF